MIVKPFSLYVFQNCIVIIYCVVACGVVFFVLHKFLDGTVRVLVWVWWCERSPGKEGIATLRLGILCKSQFIL